MSNHQSNRQSGSAPSQGAGMGAPGTTGAYTAHDPLGAPGSTGASITNMGAPGYDPTAYRAGGGGQEQMHRPSGGVSEQEQHHRPSGGAGTGLGYTYGTAASMGPTAAGYHAGVHVPVTSGVSHMYETVDVYDIGDVGGAGGGGGYDTGKTGGRAHGGIGGERGDRGQRHEMTDTVEDPGAYDVGGFREMGSEHGQGIIGGERGDRGQRLAEDPGAYDVGGFQEFASDQGGGRGGHVGGYDTTGVRER